MKARKEYHRHYEEVKNSLLDRQLIGRLLRYLYPYRYLLAIAIALMILAKGLEAYVPVYIGQVTRTILASASMETSQKLDLPSQIIGHCFTIIALLGTAYFLDSVNVVLKNWIGQRGIYKLRAEIYSHIQEMPLEFYNRSAVGTLMTRTIHDVEQINQMFSEGIVPLIGSMVLFAGISIALAMVDWRAAMVLAAVLPPVFLLTNHFRYHQRRCFNKVRGIAAAMNAFVQEHLMGASTIRSFGLQEEEKKQFDQINEDHRNANVETIHYFAFFFSGIDFLQSLSLITVFVVLIHFSGAASTFDPGTYFTFSLYILMLFRPLGDLAERYNLLQSAMAAAERIFYVLDIPIEQGLDQGEEMQQIESIDFEDVWCAYKEEHWVLKGFNLSIRKGDSIALVGVTGAGKTTILNLLMGFYPFQKGKIRINGKDIRAYSLRSLRGQFGIVLQDPEIFSGSILENISLWKPEISREQVETVVDYVHLRPLVSQFPDGIDHVLNERGKSISAGQRQLISMARVIAHERSLLILDEATANIDSQTEKWIQEVLKMILRDKTSIVIAHRLSTIKDVDRIVVLYDGAVKEEGSHQQLLKAKGIYEKLYRLQFK